MEKRRLILGSRGSQLALTQSGMIRDELQRLHPDLDVTLEIIKTSGDLDQKTDLNHFASMGVFVKELQNALLDKRIDFAVHSLKDVPDECPAELLLAAFPEREDPRDALLSRGVTFDDLPQGAKVGTGSPRRVVQLKHLRPDLTCEPLRGNLDTRIRKMEEGEYAAIILAAAGLKRLGWQDKIVQCLSLQQMIPAVGQAALALECRKEDSETRSILSVLDDAVTRTMVSLERKLMRNLGGGCKVPLAAHAYPYGNGIRMLALAGDPETGNCVRVEQSALEEDSHEMILTLIERLREGCLDRKIPFFST